MTADLCAPQRKYRELVTAEDVVESFSCVFGAGCVYEKHVVVEVKAGAGGSTTHRLVMWCGEDGHPSREFGTRDLLLPPSDPHFRNTVCKVCHPTPPAGMYDARNASRRLRRSGLLIPAVPRVLAPAATATASLRSHVLRVVSVVMSGDAGVLGRLAARAGAGGVVHRAVMCVLEVFIMDDDACDGEFARVLGESGLTTRLVVCVVRDLSFRVVWSGN